MKHEFDCTICKKHKVHEDKYTTGYAVDDKENKICFDCCGYEDKAYMVINGKNVLYLSTKEEKPSEFSSGGKRWSVSNWPGTYKANVFSYSIGRHNWGLKRYNIWFHGPDGFIWYGYTIGDNTQICHCKRTIKKS